MARPKIAEGEKRSARSEQRYTLAELEFIREQAGRAGMQPSEFIRRRALSLPVAAAPSARSDPALVSELNRIGVNLNQVARAMNADRRFQIDPDLVLEKLDQALDEVLKTHGA